MITPISPMAKPLIAPSTAPNSMARAVPSPCAAEPKASPLATRLLTWQRSRMAGPTIPPKSPQPNTITAVSDGMPFECSDKEIAMGMVTDLGCSDEVIVSSTPMILQIAMTLTIPTIPPAKTAVSTGISFPLICSICS